MLQRGRGVGRPDVQGLSPGVCLHLESRDVRGTSKRDQEGLAVRQEEIQVRVGCWKPWGGCVSRVGGAG